MTTSEIISLCSLVLCVLTFFLGRITVAKTDGKTSGETIATIKTELSGLKDLMTRIETGICDRVKGVEGRVDEMSRQIIPLAKETGQAYESAKMLHNRLTEHLRREHGKDVIDMYDGKND